MIKGTNHVGISVADLDRSIKFYSDAFGMEVVAQIAFDEKTEEGRYERILGLKGAAGRVAVLKVGDTQLELFEFSNPVPRRADPSHPVCDHGISHFCLEVSDIEVICDRLKAAGASFHCPPLLFFGRTRATYVRDPEGNVFELIERVNSAVREQKAESHSS
jgi:catechol 2,3-dioxygenase-like lactoylglutathione lyase family enzyme